MALTLKELNQKIEKALHDADEITSKGIDKMTTDDVGKIRAISKDLEDLYDQRSQVEETEAMIKDLAAKRSDLVVPTGVLTQPGNPNVKEGQTERYNSVGEWFVKSTAFTEYRPHQRSGPEKELPVGHFLSGMPNFEDTKDLFNTTDYPSRDVRLPGFIEQPRLRPTIADLIPQGTITAAALTYVAELMGENNAAFVAEGDPKPESALTFEEREAFVRKIATWLPVTDEIMQDEAALRSVIDARLRLFIMLAEEDNLVNGPNNTAPNFRGILNEPDIQTQAKGTDPTPDAVMRAMTKIQVNAKFQASGVVMNPFDWQNVRLLKTADGVYIWGAPSEEGPMRIWGLPVVPSEAMPEGTALVGAFNVASQIFRRTGINFSVSDSHADFFVTNRLAIRAEERLAFVIYRPAAFCTVTGLAS